MSAKTLKKHAAIMLALFAAVFFMAACGSSEPAEKVYLEDSEIDAALSDGDSYKGKYINISGKVFSIDKDGDTTAMQVWYDVENAEQQFIVVDSLQLAEAKTRVMANVLKNLNVTGKALVVTADVCADVVRAARNIPGVDTTVVTTLNVYDVMNHGKMIITQDAVRVLEEVYC